MGSLDHTIILGGKNRVNHFVSILHNKKTFVKKVCFFFKKRFINFFDIGHF